MADSWCGCGNYESCYRCLNNHDGDMKLEEQRALSELRQHQRNEISRLYTEINILTRRKEMLERLIVPDKI